MNRRGLLATAAGAALLLQTNIAMAADAGSVVKHYLVAWNAHDIEKAGSFFAEDGTYYDASVGTPVVGMGFRISTEVGRMAIDMVWAEIALAAVVGSLFYGAIALLERAVTFWHPSYR